MVFERHAQQEPHIHQLAVIRIERFPVVILKRIRAAFHSFQEQIEFIGIGDGPAGVFQRDEVIPVALEDGMGKSDHAERRTAPERIVQKIVVAVGDGLADHRRAQQDLYRRDHAVGIFPGDQPLRKHRQQSHPQIDGGLFLQMHRIHVDQPFDGLDRVGGVESGNDQVPGQRSIQSRLHRVQVPDLADHDHIRILPHGAPHGLPESAGMRTDFPLRNQRFHIRMQKFDGVFDRQDMFSLRLVDLVDDRTQCGGFSAAGGTGDQDQPALFPAKSLQHRRQIQFGDVQLVPRKDRPDRRRRTVGAGKEIQPEPFTGGKRPRGIRRTGMLITFFRIGTEHPAAEIVDLGSRHRYPVGRKNDVSADPVTRNFICSQKQIGCMGFQCMQKNGFYQIGHYYSPRG